MSTIPLPPVTYLRSRLRLLKDGRLVWRARPASQFSASCYAKMWNKRFAGCVTGSDKGNGYLTVVIDGVKYQAHRIAYAIAKGKDPGHKHIDHRDGKRSENHSGNLRLARNVENIRHRTRRNCNNTSGVHGVYWSKAARKWCAVIRANGHNIHLGLFVDLAAAAKVRRAAERKYFGRFAPII
jgi:hypothetical protein